MLCVERRRPQATRISNPWRHHLDLRAIDVISSRQMVLGINNITFPIFLPVFFLQTKIIFLHSLKHT